MKGWWFDEAVALPCMDNMLISDNPESYPPQLLIRHDNCIPLDLLHEEVPRVSHKGHDLEDGVLVLEGHLLQRLHTGQELSQFEGLARRPDGPLQFGQIVLELRKKRDGRAGQGQSGGIAYDFEGLARRVGGGGESLAGDPRKCPWQVETLPGTMRFT